MSFNGLNFTYNGKSSEDYGIQLVHVGENTITQSFSSPKTFIGEKVRFKNNFYYGAERGNYSLSFQIARLTGEEEFTFKDRLEVTRFFCEDDEFHAFTCENEFPNIEFIVQLTKIQFVSLRKNIGYFDVELQSNDPYPFSSMDYIERDLSDNVTSAIIELPNHCNTSPYFTPNFMEFELVGDSTSFKLKNLSNGGKELTFTNLDLLETVAINSNQEILSSTGNERISKFNFGFNAIELVYGINRLEITGKCKLRFKIQCPIQI